MKQDRPFPKRKSFWIALVLVALCVPTAFCCSVIVNSEFPAETRAPEAFPESDLVYVISKGIGFVDADGSNRTELVFSAKIVGGRFSGYSGRAVRPVFAGDDQLIAVQVKSLDYFGMNGEFELALWRAGALPSICWDWGRQPLTLLSKDQEHVIVQIEGGIALYELGTCETEAPPVQVIQDVAGVPSPDLRFVAHVMYEGLYDRVLSVRDVTTGEESRLGLGDYPSWSRDGTSVAYTGTDGLYVADLATGRLPRRVLAYVHPAGVLRSAYSNINDIVPPQPAWSPDGQWLVYHKPTAEDMISSPDSYSIFKLNLATGEESKIVDYGLYPSWRWPVQDP